MNGGLIGLIGATAPKFFCDKFRPIVAKHDYAWYGWTIPIRRETLPILKSQINDKGFFNLYGYSSTWPEGGYTKATHKIEAIFVVKKVVSHCDTGIEANPCPEMDKGIHGYNNWYLLGYESGHGKHGNTVLPRRTWFAVSDIIERTIDLSERIFTPWNLKHKIHPSALLSNFIDIVDNLQERAHVHK